MILRLQPTPFEVLVHSDPDGAEVLLDGKAKGRTPMLLTVPGPGRHQLSLALDGHVPWTAIPERYKPLPDPVKLLKVGAPKPVARSGPTGKFHGEIQP